MEVKENEIDISINNPSIEKDSDKCIQCGYCKKACTEEATVLRMYELGKVNEPICINCGMCANICPTEAIHERFDYLEIKKLLKEKNKTIIFSIAPAVRASICEAYNMESVNQIGRIVTVLKNMGANYVFDISFGADLTIMEESNELERRINDNSKLPMFTSCCPSWVKYLEIFYPELIPNLSTCKSPIMMEGAIIKTYFAKEKNINPEDIIHITVAPCTSKKTEIKIKELNSANKYWNKENINDVDYVLTTRELIMLIDDMKIDFKNLEETKFDSLLKDTSSAGIMFGNTGGVMEASLRTLYYRLTGKNLENEDIIFNDVRGLKGIKEISITINDREIKCAVVNGMKNVKGLLDKIKNNEVSYDFIEVMACNGGCINGGGQPKMTLLEMNEKKESRMNILYNEDNNKNIRFCHDNKDIKKLYDDFLIESNSELSEKLLHRSYEDKSYLLGGGNND